MADADGAVMNVCASQALTTGLTGSARQFPCHGRHVTLTVPT